MATQTTDSAVSVIAVNASTISSRHRQNTTFATIEGVSDRGCVRHGSGVAIRQSVDLSWPTVTGLPTRMTAAGEDLGL
jgi:hypothetical protein